MLKFQMINKFFLFIALSCSASAYAVGGGGGWGFGGNLGFINSSQTQMNEVIKRANVNGSTGPVSTSSLNSAYEFAPFLNYRFSGTMYALHFRPSYFYQKETGKGATGSFDMAVTGWTVFPMLRLYPLENAFMKFYMQFGLGYGRMNGEINQGTGNKVEFASGTFGTAVGLGAEFCFTANHCANLEGTYRYLSYDRSLVTSSSGSNGELSSIGKGNEIEMDGADLSVSMSGLMFMAGYTFWF